MNRKPLPYNYRLSMTNGGEYTIKNLIGEGGFSLIYSADTVGGTTSVVIKEFFPSEGATRNEKDMTVVPIDGNEDNFRRNLLRFENEGIIGGRVSQVCFQTIPFMKISSGYAVMRRESDDMRSIYDLVGIWKEKPPLPLTGKYVDRDPVFPDMVRIRYTLRIIESVLTALGKIHESGYLHLDITRYNIIWAGSDVETGENCEAFFADFGCAVKMNSREYYPECKLSYSPGFAAPEVQGKCSLLTPATDLYSVGILLFYLCVGENALEITHNRKRQIQRESAYLAIPDRIRTELQRIIIKATGVMSDRYQSACDMLPDIRRLRNTIPIHPINPDNSKSFTLYSLKSMLTGSEDTHYSWADELRDRRGCDTAIYSEGVYSGLYCEGFDSDMHFLQSILSQELYDFLLDKIDEQPDRNSALEKILSCNYNFVWKRDICNKVRRYGTRRLLQVSRSLLINENAFFVHQRILFELLGEEDERLKACYYNCARDIRRAPYVGLAMFILYALLGPDGFSILLPSPTRANDLFFAL